MSTDSHSRPAGLRILQVVLSRGFAGTERAVAELSNALGADHAVALVVRSDHRGEQGASIRDAIGPRVQVFEVPAFWRTRAALRRAVRQWDPDIIHTHLRRGTRYVAQLRTGVPHVATLHIGLNGRHYLRTDGLLCISDWQVEIVNRAGYRGRCTIVPNSLLPQPPMAPERLESLRVAAHADGARFVVGAVGRLTRRKGFDLLIEAFRRAAMPDARLVIVGDGSARRDLERRAEGLPVTFTGFRSDAKDWFQIFDVFVCPSRVEPFGRVIVEALDAGTPVIATATMGPRDIALRYPVDLVPVEDVEALAAALKSACATPPPRRSVDLSDFHIARVAERVLACYREVIQGRPRAGG